jgi:ppGpp synthetase/RelA/SpoT-type nucleotidyltranferase
VSIIAAMANLGEVTGPPERVWSIRQLKRMSRQLRHGEPADPEDPSYEDVMVYYNDLATWVQAEIKAIDWSPLLGDVAPTVVSRPKTIDTLLQKLERTPGMHIGTVQDIAGIRFEAEMTLDQQDAVAETIAGRFGHGTEALRDLRKKPHSGYRAVHVWLRFEGAGRAEVQIRTHLQGQWANVFERAADVYGREIRYDQMPADPHERDIIERLINMSTSGVHDIEDTRNWIAERDLLTDDAERGVVSSQQLPADLQARFESVRARLLETEKSYMESMQTLVRTFDSLQQGRKDT